MLPNKLKGKFFDSLSRRTIRYVEPISLTDAEGVVAEVYEQVAEEFFINGAITAHSVNPPLLVGMWVGGRELVLVDDGMTRDAKEALGSTFAQLNGCTYCEDMLVGVTYATPATDLAAAIRKGEQASFGDEETAALHRWAQATLSPESELLHRPPFSAELAAEALGVAFMFHYLNRFTRVFFTGSPVRGPMLFDGLTTSMLRTFAVELRPSVMRRLQPGRGNHLLPAAALPDDLWWARGNPVVAEPIARWVAAVEREGHRYLSVEARRRVEAFLSQWHGQPMGLSRAWIEAHTGGLLDDEAAAVRIALLTAVEGSQIDDALVDDFLESWTGPDPKAALVTTAVWAALTCSRRITGWIARAALSTLPDWSKNRTGQSTLATVA